MKTLTSFLLGAALVIGLPGAASAQSRWVSPFLGTTMGNDLTHNNATTGIAAGWMVNDWLGVEGEVADSPQFFEQTGFLTDRRVATVMGNALVSVRSMKSATFMVYGTGGLGMVHTHVEEAGGFAVVDASKFGFNLGGGLIGNFNKMLGLRGEVKYFHTTGQSDADTNPFGIDFSTFSFWRTSIGLVVRF